MNEQTIKKLDQYEDNFDDVFPLMQYNFSEHELFSIINKCIINNKPVEYFYPLEYDVLY